MSQDVPIQYQVLPRERLIVVDIAGDPSALELVNYFGSIQPFPTISHFGRLILMRNIDSPVSQADLAASARALANSQGHHCNHRTAVVAPSPLALSLVRAYMLIANPAKSDFRVYRGLASALEWLGAPRWSTLYRAIDLANASDPWHDARQREKEPEAVAWI